MQDLPPNYLLPEESTTRHGKKVIQSGKVAAIALAGGHGSRLGYDAPKGCFPITKDGKSLYQMVAEKTLSAADAPLMLGIMTSDATHEKTCEHFEKANFFGLKQEQVIFFKQENLPVEDETGKSMPIFAPNGNGAIFWLLEKQGLLASWQKKGIEHIVIFTIDNALADPFPPPLVGLHDLHKNDVTLIGVKRETEQEHVGVLIEREKKLKVVEYSEIEEDALAAKDMLKFPLANISYFVFSMSFIEEIVKHPLTDLPLHKAKKKIPTNGSEEYFYKSEYFIFDVLDFAKKAEVLLLPRKECFAPLKNKVGAQSIDTVRAALDLSIRKEQ